MDPVKDVKAGGKSVGPLKIKGAPSATYKTKGKKPKISKGAGMKTSGK